MKMFKSGAYKKQISKTIKQLNLDCVCVCVCYVKKNLCSNESLREEKIASVS